ncbi:MAG: type II secretion system F family protein [Elusimicrobia bacterium]|nr:type II secretion system F family protein [Elusimicrobiota bacterium]
MQFTYVEKDSGGKTIDGVLEAIDQKAAVERLRVMKLTLVDISEKEAGGALGLISKLNPFKPKVKSKDLAIFSRQLSTLVSAGVPIVQGLGILEAQTENPAFKKIVGSVKLDIESGIGITDAMRKHPDPFTTLYVSMVKAGEVGGILDIILERLSNYLEQSESLKSKIKSAMVYPAVICIVAILITVFLLIFVIPTFKEIFSDFGAELPLPTRILLSTSDIMRKNIIYIAMGFGGLIFLMKKFYQTESGRHRIDKLLLGLPVFGMLLKKVAIAKFTRTLGTLVSSGVPILQGLDTVASTAGNVVIEKAILQCRQTVREGGRLVDPLKKAEIFPPMVVQMIGTGEETGSLDKMLERIADFYDQEVDSAVKGLTSMIEPMIIVVMGLVVGSIVIAMFLPMFELSQLASNAG